MMTKGSRSILKRVIQQAALIAILILASSLGASAAGSVGVPFAWGNNPYGQSGAGTMGDFSNRPVPVIRTGALAGKTLKDVKAGTSHSLALASDGSVYAWGDNLYGELGNGTTTRSVVPVAVTTAGTPMAGKTITAIAAGEGFSLALASDGSVYSWGDGGLLGDGNGAQSNVPAAVFTKNTPISGKTIVAIAAGSYHSLALASDGSVYSWGDNWASQLGNGTIFSSNIPTAVTTTGTPMAGKFITAISAGENFSLALASDGSVYTWGDNQVGELGNGTGGASKYDSSVPVAVTTAGTPMAGKIITSISAGGFIGLALASDNTLYAWGDNQLGGLGDGTYTTSYLPVEVITAHTPMAGKTITAISGGYYHCLALASDGSLYAWGDNQYGDLGDSTYTTAFPFGVPSPALVSESGVLAISAGYGFSLALVAPGPNADRVNPNLVLQNSSNQQVAFWLTNGTTLFANNYLSIVPAMLGGSPAALPAGWQVAGVGDFNGDGNLDLALDNPSNGQTAFWLMNGANVLGGVAATMNGSPATLPAGWQLMGAGDFNGDGQTDLVLQNPSTGQVGFWLMNGTTVTSGVFATQRGVPLTLPSGWQVAGAGDFNGDGQTDLVLQNPSTGQVGFWLMNGTTVTSGVLATLNGAPITLPAHWKIVALGDANGDGNLDLTLENPSTGQIAFWLMQGTTVTSGTSATQGGAPTSLSAGWDIFGPR